MQVKFILLALKDCQIVRSAYLSSSGIETEKEFFVVGKNKGIFDTYEEAIKVMESIKNQHGFDGFKIDTIYLP